MWAGSRAERVACHPQGPHVPTLHIQKGPYTDLDFRLREKSRKIGNHSPSACVGSRTLVSGSPLALLTLGQVIP